MFNFRKCGIRSKLYAIVRHLRRADWTKIQTALALLRTGRFQLLAYGIVDFVQRQNLTRQSDVSAHFACLVSDDSNASKPAWGEPIDIIIPVYNGKQYLGPLFDSLLRNTTSPYRLVIIDDCSSDPDVVPLLQSQVERFDNILLLRNAQNIGFVGSVNRAAGEAKHHFVILNTDTEVPPRWLERLMNPILADKTIASTTPFTNAGTICSFPQTCTDNQLIFDLSGEVIDACFAKIPLVKPSIELPTGIGFCMGFNGAVVNRIGLFDPIFGKGYCEENDWCMRTRRAGYRHILVNNLFVYHKHGGSFTSEDKSRLMERNHEILVSRYPDYDHLVLQHVQLDPARTIRKLAILLLSCRHATGSVLIIDHNIGGGANQYRRKIVASSSSEDRAVITFMNDHKSGNWLLDFVYKDQTFQLDLPDISWLSVLCKRIRIEEIFYNNAVTYADPAVVLAELFNLKVDTGAKLIVAFHDYFPICPSYTLLNKEGRYCGVPDDISICERCLPNIPSRFNENIPKNISIKNWRQTWERMLSSSDEIRCFSESSRSIVLKAYPSVAAKVNVVPHIVDWVANNRPRINYDAPMHIGVVGGINYAKGLDVVLGLVDIVRKRKKIIKVTVIGEVAAKTPIRGLTVTGRYNKDELPILIERLGINIFFIPSVCPETFSYVTSELISMEVPLVCFDLGAPAERVAEYSRGCVLPMETDSEILLDSLSAFYAHVQKEAQ